MRHTLNPQDPITSFDYKLFSLPEEQVEIIAKEFTGKGTDGVALLDVKMRGNRALCPKCQAPLF